MDVDDESFSLPELLAVALDNDASDIYLHSDKVPRMRVNQRAVPVPGFSPIPEAKLQQALYSFMSTKRRIAYEETHEANLAYTLHGRGRFRVNVLKERGKVASVMRAVRNNVIPFHELGLPDHTADLINLRRGLILVVGDTGSGKTSTLTTYVDMMNRTQEKHILTIENPIEYVHEDHLSVITQREIGEDTLSGATALNEALRQKPDVIVVAEIRDRDEADVAIRAAESGHVVFATVHASSAEETISRFLSMYPSDAHGSVAQKLSQNLAAILCQSLVPSESGDGVQLISEVLRNTSNMRGLIRGLKMPQMQNAIEQGTQMQTRNQSLAHHVRQGNITLDTAVEFATNEDDFYLLFKGKENAERIARQALRDKYQSD